jgi:hypothetical protein
VNLLVSRDSRSGTRGGLGIQLRRVGSGRRKTFADGEQLLSAWMSENAFVSWVIRERPWELEHDLLGAVDLPLNLEGNIGPRVPPGTDPGAGPGALPRQMRCRSCLTPAGAAVSATPERTMSARCEQ